MLKAAGMRLLPWAVDIRRLRRLPEVIPLLQRAETNLPNSRMMTVNCRSDTGIILTGYSCPDMKGDLPYGYG